MKDKTAVLEQVGAWVAGLTVADVPASTLRAARWQALNMLAAATHGARSAAARPILPAVLATAGAGRARVIGTDARLGPVDAVLANAAHAMAHDFDDIIWMGHTCHSAVFAPLAVADHLGEAGEEALLLAIVAANEVGGRLGASCFLGPLNGQMVAHIHLVGAAAGAAKLLGLDATRTTHALAIALANPTFPLQPGFMRPTSKLMIAALPAAAGLRAAFLAREGMSGAPDILEDPRGFWSRYAFLPIPAMFGDLGQFWALETLTIKTYPGCHFFQTACTAIERIRARKAMTLADVDRVTIDTTKLACEVTRFGGEYANPDAIEPVNVNFDQALTAAVLLHAGKLTPSELDPIWLGREEAGIRAWRQKIDVRHDPALTARVVLAARAVGAGRKALASVKPRDLLGLTRRYRSEYNSRLISVEELVGLARALVGGRTRTKLERKGHAVPLPFPARVTVAFRDGERLSEELDLPVGAYCADGAELAVASKVAAAGIAMDAPLIA